MRTEKNENTGQSLVRAQRSGTCVSCGAPLTERRRKYCRPECRAALMRELAWLTDLLMDLRAERATFSFTERLILINVLPRRSDTVFTYAGEKTPRRRPAQALRDKRRELEWEWYTAVGRNYRQNRRTSQACASAHILDLGATGVIEPEEIRPTRRLVRPHTPRELRILGIPLEALMNGDPREVITRAFRRAAMLNHPDRGGDDEAMKRINEAYAELRGWKLESLLNRRPTKPGCRVGLPNHWSYESETHKWSPPLG